jgi:hypothetical protein
MNKQNRIWLILKDGKPYMTGKRYSSVVAFLTEKSAHSLYGTIDAKESGYTIKMVKF